MNNRYLAILVWISAEAVLQIHGICFWQEHGGWQGWLWSVVLCVVTVWFWLHHRASIRYTFGIVASVLLLAGPLWQVGAPLVDALELRYAQQRNVALQVATLRNSEALQVATLQTFLRNSEARTGWAPLIVAAQKELSITRERLTMVSAAPAVARAAFLSVAVIVIQLLALVVLQVAAVAALLVIRCTFGVAIKSRRVHGVVVKSAVSGMQSPVKPSGSEDSALIKLRIARGDYGEQPSLRQVMRCENMRHPEARVIFNDLIASGALVVVGNRVRLAV